MGCRYQTHAALPPILGPMLWANSDGVDSGIPKRPSKQAIEGETTRACN